MNIIFSIYRRHRSSRDGDFPDQVWLFVSCGINLWTSLQIFFECDLNRLNADSNHRTDDSCWCSGRCWFSIPECDLRPHRVGLEKMKFFDVTRIPTRLWRNDDKCRAWEPFSTITNLLRSKNEIQHVGFHWHFFWPVPIDVRNTRTIGLCPVE